MTRITIHSIVGVPELTECLSSYLTTSDVAHAMATCKAWSRQFQPFLWANLRTGTLPETVQLEQNLHLVRTVDLYVEVFRSVESSGLHSLDVLATLSRGLPFPLEMSGRESKPSAEAKVALCTNLRRIKTELPRRAYLEEESSYWLHLRPLLHNNTNLTHLHVEFIGSIPSTTMPAISALCRLQHLTIRGWVQKESCLLSLLRACLPLPRLSELYCYFNVDFGEYTLEYESEEDYEELEDIADPKEELKAILEEAIAARTSEYGSIDTKIKALRFPGSADGNLGPLVFPILKSELVQIETLEVPDFKDYPSEDIYEEMVRKFCPGLRHLVIPPYYGEDHPATVCSFIRGATELKTVRGRRFTDAFGSNSSKMMPTLITHHSTTLEELELLECTWISSPVQQAVLASCKNLRRFWVASASNLSCDHGLRFQDIVAGEWSCLGLRELCLTLNRAIDYKSAMVTIQQELSSSTDQEVSKENKQEEEEKDLHQLDDPEQKRLVDAWAAKRVYMQIGRLVVLETLALRRDKDTYTAEEDGRVSAWDLTLSEGWLAKLAGLKNLRHLHMSTDYWSRMGQAEVEFMETEWPLLGEISFGLTESGLEGLIKQPHWQWLKQKRPHVRLTCYQS